MHRKPRFLRALVIFLVVCGILVTGTALMRTKGSSALGSSSFGKKAEAALINIEGIITGSSGDSGPFGGITGASSMRIVQDLKDYTEDDSIKGIIIRIDSPGGSAAASDEIWNAISKATESKPVVVSMGDVAASGGYYVASAATYIYANPSTLTGSIGVIFDLMEFSGLFEKIGIGSNTIIAGKHKDIGSSSRPMTNEERELLQELLDQVHNQFIERVATGRGMDVEDVREIATGMIYTGERAVELGLVDEVGGFEDAFAELEERTGETLTLREPPEPSFWDFLMGTELTFPVDLSLLDLPVSNIAATLYLNTLLARGRMY